MRLIHCVALGMLGLASVAGAQSVQRVRIMPLPQVGLQKADSMEASRARATEVLRAINIENPPLGTPVTLSVRTPFVDSGTHLAFEGFRMVRPGTNSAESMLGPKASTVIVAWEADPAKRYVVDCEMRFAMPNPEPVMVFKDVGDGEKMVDVAGNRAAFITTAGRVGRVWVTGNGAFDFQSCTITPFG